MMDMRRSPLVQSLLLCALGCSGAPTAESPDLAAPALRGAPLRFPVEDPAAIEELYVIGMDHSAAPDPVPVRCVSYQGLAFPSCYAGHEGTDFLLIGGFAAMDAGSAFAVAAAPGVVAEIEDGHYDRCHGNFMTATVDCDGHEMRANRVVVDHAGGLRTEYYHLMKGSILVQPGQRVACGERLARIGSSGRSSLPHLHLNLFEGGERRDPYAGPFSQPRSYWNSQPTVSGVLPAAVCAAP